MAHGNAPWATFPSKGLHFTLSGARFWALWRGNARLGALLFAIFYRLWNRFHGYRDPVTVFRTNSSCYTRSSRHLQPAKPRR